MMLRAQPGLLDVPRYLSEIELTENYLIRSDLSLNENPFGPSPFAIDAFQNSAKEIFRYPDGDCSLLRNAIGEQFNLSPAQVMCGAGSDELIALLTRVFAGPNDEVVFPEYSFIMFSINAKRVGAKVVQAKAHHLGANVQAILDCITSKTSLIFIANPNNPTGTYLTAAELKSLADKIPAHIILVIDSAYAEYVEETDYADGKNLVDEYPNVVMLRTFSKIYALAALRLGWAYASLKVIDLLERARNPYNVSIPAQVAGLASIQDIDHLKKARIHNKTWRDKMMGSLQKKGISIHPSVGNFMLLEFPDDQTALRAFTYLLANGVKTRPLASYQLNRYLRVTIGLPSENEHFLTVMNEFQF